MARGNHMPPFQSPQTMIREDLVRIVLAGLSYPVDGFLNAVLSKTPATVPFGISRTFSATVGESLTVVPSSAAFAIKIASLSRPMTSAENQKLVPLRCSRRSSGVRARSASLGPLGPSASSRSSARRSSRFSAWVSFGNSAMISLIVILGSRFVSFGCLNRKYRTIPVASIITQYADRKCYPLHFLC